MRFKKAVEVEVVEVKKIEAKKEPEKKVEIPTFKIKFCFERMKKSCGKCGCAQLLIKSGKYICSDCNAANED